jgi:predicted amidohydrolase
MKLRIATCQFAVSGDVRRNARAIVRQMRTAKQRGAHVAHFCEGALTGYIDSDIESHADVDWDEVETFARRVADEAGRLRLWVMLGASHRLSGRHRPHNSVYVIDDRGRLVDRYDKRFCSGNRAETEGELAHYSPGDHPVVVRIRGVVCGVLICYEYRYPELLREYKRRGVEVVFHSFHAGNADDATLRTMRRQVGSSFHRLNRGSTLPEITMPASMLAAAASNHVWISCSNTSARESCWPAFFVRADGVVSGRLRRNRAGVLISTVDTKQRLYESTRDWRERALRGVLHSGRRVRDPRSQARRSW